MNAGELRHRVILQAKTVTRGNYGEEVIVWRDIATIWAKIEPLSGREYFQSQQMQSEISHKITIRYREDVKADWQMVYGTRIFNILSVMNTEERKRELILMCREMAI